MSRELLPIERVRNPSARDFEAIILQDRPVIIEGLVSNWIAHERWNAHYLTEKIGDLRIDVRSSPTHLHPDFSAMRANWSRPWFSRAISELWRRKRGASRPDAETMRFADFVKLLSNAPEPFRFLAGAEELTLFYNKRWNPAFSALREDFFLPEYVPENRLERAAFWVSAEGVRSHLHYDGGRVHNLNAQISGSKHVELYSPDQMGKLYPYLFTDGRPHVFSQVNVEDAEPARFPLFGQAEGYEATLVAGDLLLIPAYWYHTFKHLGSFNLNVNFWWRAENVRLSPVSIREHLGEVSYLMLKDARIPPVWLAGSMRKLERTIAQDGKV